ncbi:hypothetical protein MKX34_17165 [Paenibacillus sp. FSL R5-0636]|uniref:hyaluronate lyase N-terminal domain-containing protein n=1 Tax=Paenibacillus TaxID=44249 RepID=UPI00096F8C56|nr:hypothetical protein [Paenibacillus odorifer]OMD03487.1 hypothetical protein BJP49_01340 [Paenibacillus odorifer]
MPVIKIKRGLAANVPALTLEAGELALATDTGKVYVGTGSGDKVMVNPDQAAAETAVKLKTARTIALAGDATGSTPFDGSANATITVVLPNLATAGTYTKLTINAKGQVISATQITAADIPMLTLSKISDAGTAASKNTGTAAGNVPLIGANGKLDDSILPALAISDTFVVASQAAMLALTAEVGDIAVRTDLNKTFILRLSGASTLANWQEILAPTAAVSSVAGKTGVVTLSASDVGLGNVTNESKATMFTNPSFTNPVVTTQATSDNSTKAASTAFVKAQGYLSVSDTIDGGTF